MPVFRASLQKTFTILDVSKNTTKERDMRACRTAGLQLVHTGSSHALHICYGKCDHQFFFKSGC